MKTLIFLRPESEKWVDSSETSMIARIFGSAQLTYKVRIHGYDVQRQSAADSVPYDPDSHITWMTDIPIDTESEGFCTQRGLDCVAYAADLEVVRNFYLAVSEGSGFYKERIARTPLPESAGCIEHRGSTSNLTVWGNLSLYYIYYKGNSAILITDAPIPFLSDPFKINEMLIGAYIPLLMCKRVTLNLEYIRRKHHKWLNEFRNNLLVYSSTRHYLSNHVVEH